MAKKYKCEDCGSAVESLKYLNEKHVCRPTTRGGQTGQTTTTSDPSGSETVLTQDNPTEVNNKVGSDAPGSDGSGVLLSSLDKRERGQNPDPRDSDPDGFEVAVPNRDLAIISFLSAHVDLLDDYETRFFHSMKYRVNSQLNHVTPAQREYLQQIEAVVKGLLDQDRRERESMRRSAHWLAIREPGHISEGCDLCDELKRERIEADKRADLSFIEDVISLHDATLRKRGKDQKPITVNELTGEAVLERVQARSLQGDPEAARMLEMLRVSEARFNG